MSAIDGAPVSLPYLPCCSPFFDILDDAALHELLFLRMFANITSESEALLLAFPKIGRWLQDTVGACAAIHAYTERRTSSGTRVDGLLAGLVVDEDDGEIFETVAIEVKSLKTVRQLVRRYQASTGLAEAGLVGVTVAAVATGPLGWIAAGATALLRAKSHQRAAASLQTLNYPGDFRVLLLPKEVFSEFSELKQPLIEEAEEHGFGLVTVTPRGRLYWYVEPERHIYGGLFSSFVSGDWLDDYVTGEHIRNGLRVTARD